VTLDENNQINHHHSRRKRRVVRRHVVSESENDQPQQQQQQLHHRVKIMNQPELNNSSQMTKGTKVKTTFVENKTDNIVPHLNAIIWI
jgi:hypothetical protein